MFILINKKEGITSHDVVNRVRKVSGVKRVGHAGTLDPFATGLLLIGIGRESTKKLWEMTKGSKKEYRAKIVLGFESDTFDKSGKIKKVSDKKPSEVQIRKKLNEFEGEITQTPPIYSAIKVKGKKAYQYARKGEEVVLKKRKAVIYKAKLEKYEYPFVFITFLVSSGTYIRSLAHDLGERLKVGGYLESLKRTRIGKYKLEDAINIDDLDEKALLSKTF